MRPTPAQIAFALTLTAVGILGLINPAYPGIWQPFPHAQPLRAILAIICALIALATGPALLWPHAAPLAAKLLTAALLLWLLCARLPPLLHAPTLQDPWSGLGETTLVLAATWALARRLTPNPPRQTPPRQILTPTRLAALALIPFGTAHFVYAAQTAALVPAYLPAHHTIALATGTAYLAAALALLTGIAARPAAILVTIQIALFTLLVWGPVIAAGHPAPFQISESIISLALTASAWLIAEEESQARSFLKKRTKKLSPTSKKSSSSRN